MGNDVHLYFEPGELNGKVTYCFEFSDGRVLRERTPEELLVLVKQSLLPNGYKLHNGRPYRPGRPWPCAGYVNSPFFREVEECVSERFSEQLSERAPPRNYRSLNDVVDEPETGKKQ